MKTYQGGCHCGAIRYEVATDLAQVLACNCSHCHKKGFLLHFADKGSFHLLSGAENLTVYHFNKGTIHHKFCTTCGVESFSDNDAFPKMAINARCLDDFDTSSVPTETYNGKEA